MAKPQLENGHTQIANEILEQLVKIHLSPNQWQVLLCIIRKTYGFHKKVDYIANSQLVEATGLCKAVVSRTLYKLTDMKLIIRKGKHIGFQKDWELWRMLAVQSTLATKLAEQSTIKKLAISTSKLAAQSTKVSSPAVTQKKKDTLTKKTKQMKETPKKKCYGEFKNVHLTDNEYDKLVKRFNKSTGELIEEMSIGIASKGYKYTNHYAAILSWARMDNKKQVPQVDIASEYGDSGIYKNLTEDGNE